MNEYLVLPGCDDTNRGDQALIWETVNLAKEAGFDGKYYMLASEEFSKQSEKKGISHICHILKHPSEHFNSDDNMYYTKMLKLKWGAVALFDFITTYPLLKPVLRKILLPLYNNEIKNSIKHYSSASASFVKGGGFLHAYGGFEETYKIYYFLYHINLALSFGQDVYVMPNSFGPFNAPFVKKMINKTLSKCKVVTSRESISNEALKKCDIEAINMPDLAFYLEKENFECIKSRLIEQNIPIGEKKCVAITARPYRFPGENDPDTLYQSYINEFRKFALWLIDNDFYPVFVEHVSSNLVHEDDMSAIKEIIKYLPQNKKWSVFRDTTLNCQEMKSVYSCFDYTVGTRFHSVIFSLSEQVPSIAITYGGNKGQGIMKDIKMSEYSIDIKDVNKETLVNKFKTVVENTDAIEKELANVKIDMYNQRKQFIKKIGKVNN